MDIDRLIRKIVHFEDEIHAEGERPVSPPLRRIAVGAVIKNPRLSGASGDALDELVHVSERLGVDLTMRALERLGDPASIRSYSKAVVVGSAGDLEHGAAMIHSRLAWRSDRRSSGAGS